MKGNVGKEQEVLLQMHACLFGSHWLMCKGAAVENEGTLNMDFPV